MIRTSGCCAGSLHNHVTVGRVHTTPNMRRLEDELCDTQTIHWQYKKSSNKNSLCVFGCVNVSFMYVCVTVILWVHVFWSVCASVYVPIYKLQSPTHPLRISPISDVGALGMISRGGGWRVATSLFGVVETIVVLVGAR